MAEIENQRISSSTSVAIYVHGTDLDPADVTKVLGAQPAYSWKKGESTTLSSGNVAHRKRGLWMRSVKGGNDFLLGDMVDQLVTALGQHVGAITAASGVEDAYFDIFVAVSNEKAHRGDYRFELTPLSSAAIAKSGLPLQVTFCVTED